jgi:hypothetical protein
VSRTLRDLSNFGSSSGTGSELRRPQPGWLGLIGVLLIAGCSNRAGTHAALAQHDPGLSLAPDPANSSSRIAVVFADERIHADQCRFEWRRNGGVIYDAVSDGLDPTNFSKNDEITVAVTTTDPGSGATKTLRAKVVVENSPPKIVSATLSPVTESGTAEIRANVEAVDPDHDTPTYTYRWFKNDAVVDNATGATLPMSGVARGDRVTVEVVAHDDVSASAPVRTQPFSIDNRPPVFSSQPMAPSPRDVSFQYHATATDPDGDALRYSLASGPDDMRVDPDGTVSWTLPTGDQRKGDFPVRLRATDSKGGEATQDFTIHLEPAPAPAPPAKK